VYARKKPRKPKGLFMVISEIFEKYMIPVDASIIGLKYYDSDSTLRLVSTDQILPTSENLDRQVKTCVQRDYEHRFYVRLPIFDDHDVCW